MLVEDGGARNTCIVAKSPSGANAASQLPVTQVAHLHRCAADACCCCCCIVHIPPQSSTALRPSAVACHEKDRAFAAGLSVCIGGMVWGL